MGADKEEKPAADLRRSASIDFKQPYRDEKSTLFIRPRNAKFGLVQSGAEKAIQDKIAYRKAQISIYEKTGENLKKY